MENTIKKTETHNWIRAKVKLTTGETISFTISYGGTKFAITPTKTSNIENLRAELKKFNATYQLIGEETNGAMLDRFIADMKNYTLNK